MAFKVIQSTSNRFDFISDLDPAIDWDNMTEEQKENFKKTKDKSILKFKENEQATIFVLKTNVSRKEKATLQNQTITTNSKGQMQTLIGDYLYSTLKIAIVDIINPDYLAIKERIVFKKDSNGYCNDDVIETINKIAEGKILDEILSFVNKEKDEADLDQKK